MDFSFPCISISNTTTMTAEEILKASFDGKISFP
jgi:hypothetical protein